MAAALNSCPGVRYGAINDEVFDDVASAADAKRPESTAKAGTKYLEQYQDLYRAACHLKIGDHLTQDPSWPGNRVKCFEREFTRIAASGVQLSALGDKVAAQATKILGLLKPEGDKYPQAAQWANAASELIKEIINACPEAVADPSSSDCTLM